MQPSRTVRKMPCPAEKLWTELAAGVIQGAEAERLALHAAGCPECASLLRSAVEAVGEDEGGEGLSPDDETRLKIVARKMADTGRPRVLPWRTLISVAAGLAALSAGLYLWKRADDPLMTLASAAANPRQLEFRIPRAPWAPLHVVRSDNPNAALPPEVYESRARVQRALAKSPLAPEWLHAKGRVELLEGKFDEAVKSLQGASDMGASSAEFWIDFGIAYAGRADQQDAAIDHTKAIELFSAALKLAPKNAAALFNRAISEERLTLLDGAIRDLEASMAAETDAGWREETRKKLEELRRKRAEMFDPARPMPENLKVEMAFEQALRDGLTAPGGGSLEELARRLREEHGDRWLTDALAVPRGEVRDRAVRVLGELAKIRSKSRLEEYGKFESDIAWLKAIRLPGALTAWRDFELLFRASHRPDVADCSRREGVDKALKTRYAWFALQSALEASTCDIAQGAIDAADERTRVSRMIADDARYSVASVRARGFEASHLSNEGRYREATSAAQMGLRLSLGGHLPLQRAHQSYLNLARSAERLQRWNTAQEATGMSVEVANSTSMRTLAVLGLIRQAEIAQRTGSVLEARNHLSRADALAQQVEFDEHASLYRDHARARLSALEGDYAHASALETSQWASLDVLLEVPYLNALAELDLRRQDPSAASKHARRAIARILSQPQNRERLRDEYGRAVRSLVRALVAVHDHAAALEQWRMALFQGAAIRREGPGDASGTHIAIVPFEDSIGVFLDKGGSVRFRQVPVPASALLSKLRLLLAMCADSRSDAELIHENAKALMSALFGDELTPSGHITLEAIQEWASLPLAVMFDARAAIATAAGRRKSCGRAAYQLVLAQADRVHSDFRQLPRLPSLDREARTLTQIVPSVRLIRGLEATPQNVQRSAIETRWFHFSGHATRWRQATALVVAPDTSSPSQDEKQGLWVLSEGFCAEVAFFSACSTAGFHETETVAPSQLGEAAIHAGARHAVAALWDIDSEAATQFAGQFYAAMQSGLDPASALWTAAREVRQDPRFRHPYYWAPFVVYEANG
ncbi:MAG: CHAT domain-containing protein [Bryobacteraceae bacterium]